MRGSTGHYAPAEVVHKNFANTVDLLTLATKTMLPCEAHARARALELQIEGFSGDIWGESRASQGMVVGVFAGEPSHEHRGGLPHREERNVQNNEDGGGCGA